MLETKPLAHVRHVVWPRTAFEKRPALHEPHTGEKSATKMAPLQSHAELSAALLVGSKLKRPGGQSVQTTLPSGEYFPAEHAAHVLSPADAVMEPAGHLVHVADPNVEKRPAGHTPHGGVLDSVHRAPPHSHMSTVTVPSTEAKRPPGHCAHAVVLEEYSPARQLVHAVVPVGLFQNLPF